MPDTPPALSVVMIVLNGASWIETQLDALSRQVDAPPEWEVVVADNGSTDGTQDLVRGRIASFPVPLRLVDASDAPGASHARNVGASVARAEFLAFCDCDDQVGEAWAGGALAALAEHACVGGTIRSLTVPFDADADVLNPTGLHGRGIQSCNFAVRRSVFFEVGGFDESLPPYGCEDSEFSLRILASGRPIVPTPGMVLYFRPTIGTRRILRKVYTSGVAETVVWQRHADLYGSQLSLRALVRQVVVWPASAVRDVRSGHASRREVVRSGVTSWAHLVGYLTWVRAGRAGPPRLVFRPYDAVVDG